VSTASAWDELARQDACAAVCSESWDEGIEHHLAYIEPLIEQEGRHLDFGCGVGRLLIPLIERFPLRPIAGKDYSDAPRFVGFDHSLTMLARAAERLAEKGPCPLYLGEIEDLAVLLPTFDGIWSVAVFQHIEHDLQRRYLKVLRWLLSPRGWLCCQIAVQPGVEHEGPLAHPVDAETFAGWARDAGLQLCRSAVDPVNPTWRWLLFTNGPAPNLPAWP
jgi:SAM-dependent methyltransferase